MKRTIIILALLTATSAATATAYQTWAVGQEREVDEGVYAKLYYQQAGWRVWRFQTSVRVWCKAIKSAVGKPHPYPIGVTDYMFGGTPNLVVTYQDQVRRQFKIEGAESDEKGEYRLPGQKFWSAIDAYIEDHDGETVDVHVESWEYPELSVGLADERGTLSLIGMTAALSAAEKCVVS